MGGTSIPNHLLALRRYGNQGLTGDAFHLIWSLILSNIA